MTAREAYQPGDSYLHRLHPLVKLAWLLGSTVALFVTRSPWDVLAWLAGALLLHLVANPANRQGRPTPTGDGKGGEEPWERAPEPRRTHRARRLLLGTALLLALAQVVFVHTGGILIRIGPVAVTQGGVAGAVFVAGRFLAVILYSSLFVRSTEPGALVYALVRAGLPYRYGFTFLAALRLAPVFEQEARTVYNAQLARGIRYDVRSPRRLLLLARQFTLPMLVSALGKVDAMAISMEGRCFGRYPKRTFLDTVPFTRADALVLATLPVVLAVAALAAALE